MPVNLDKPHLWKADVAKSVDMYNHWFMGFAPDAFRNTRSRVTSEVEQSLKDTDFLRQITSDILLTHPEILPTLRMVTCPPIAVDRLIGLAGVSSNLVKRMEEQKRMPLRMPNKDLKAQLLRIVAIISQMIDPDIFSWLTSKEAPSKAAVHRAATIVADRLCGAVANPIIRNAQEKRQLTSIKAWLEEHGYTQIPEKSGMRFNEIPSGYFGFRVNVPVKRGGTPNKTVNIPVDVAVMPKKARDRLLPLFLEAKSAGDFTNTNKRRKEEAAKVAQLRETYGNKVEFILFLCGYFESGYLGYEAAEGIDWIWEHRIADLRKLGL